MTLERTGTGSARFKPPVGSPAPDIFGLASPPQIVAGAEPRSPARFFVGETQDPNVYYWRIELHDVRGGLNMQSGRMDEAHDRLASSTLDSRFRGHLILPQLTTAAASPDPTGNNRLLSHANIFNTLVVGCGDAANASLFKETSSTNPALTALTFTPNGHIYALVPIIINSGGSNDTLRLAVCSSGATEILNDVATTPTSAGDMTNLSDVLGMIQTPLDDGTVLAYLSGGALVTFKKSDALSVSPTIVLQNIPQGGYALGMAALGGRPIRAWWVWGREKSDSIQIFGSEKYGRIFSTNLQGTDPQELRLPLKGIRHAALWRDGIIATDEERIVFHNGRYIKDLRWNADRTPDSDKELRCRGFWINNNGTELFIEVNQRATTSGTGNTKRWIESYDYELDAWHQVSGSTTLSTTGLLSLSAAGPLPRSDITGFGQTYADGSWYRMFMPPFGLNTFTLRKTSGAQSGTGVAFESSGTATWPKMRIPGLEGWPLSVKRISGYPDVDAGGTGGTPASVSVSVTGTASANNPAVFRTGYDRGRQMFDYWQDKSVVYEIQPSITLTQQSGGTDPTRFTPNGLPIIIEGLASRPEWVGGPPPVDRTR